MFTHVMGNIIFVGGLGSTIFYLTLIKFGTFLTIELSAAFYDSVSVSCSRRWRRQRRSRRRIRRRRRKRRRNRRWMGMGGRWGESPHLKRQSPPKAIRVAPWYSSNLNLPNQIKYVTALSSALVNSARIRMVPYLVFIQIWSFEWKGYEQLFNSGPLIVFRFDRISWRTLRCQSVTQSLSHSVSHSVTQVFPTIPFHTISYHSIQKNAIPYYPSTFHARTISCHTTPYHHNVIPCNTV